MIGRPIKSIESKSDQSKEILNGPMRNVYSGKNKRIPWWDDDEWEFGRFSLKENPGNGSCISLLSWPFSKDFYGFWIYHFRYK